MFPPSNPAPAALALARDVLASAAAEIITPDLGFANHARAVIGVDVSPDPTEASSSTTSTIGVIVISMTPSATLGAAAATQTAAASSPKDNQPGECRLLGSFAIFVQLALGGLALMSLVYKRWRERPQRPLKVWFFDASKQVFGSVLVHIANVFMSMLTSGRLSIKLEPQAAGTVAARAVGMLLGTRAEEYIPNPCSFYLLNLAIDTTLGIPILIFLLRITTKLVRYTPFGQPHESVQSGCYGSPPKAWWWLKQSVIYFCGLLGMKVCVLIIFMMFPFISRIGDWALGWTEGNERLQIIFVMMLFPLIMNALQYYIIDSFIKGKETAEQEQTATTHTGAYNEIAESDSSDDEVSDDERDRDEDGIVHMMKSPKQPKDEEYNPSVDGDDQTVVGSSTGTKPGSRGRLVPKELYPHE